jgi:hypothetical protein
LADTATRAATTAENKPVYLALVNMAQYKISSGRTKMMIPSASFFQLSAMLLSCSSASFEYMVKRGAKVSLVFSFGGV